MLKEIDKKALTKEYLIDQLREIGDIKDIGIDLIRQSAKEELEKDYLVKISEVVFDFTRVQQSLLQEGKIEEPEDDRELFFFIKEYAIRFEEMYQQSGEDNYLETVCKYAEELLLDQYGYEINENKEILKGVATYPYTPVENNGGYTDFKAWEIESSMQYGALINSEDIKLQGCITPRFPSVVVTCKNPIGENIIYSTMALQWKR